jgi:hypothetical protein
MNFSAICAGALAICALWSLAEPAAAACTGETQIVVPPNMTVTFAVQAPRDEAPVWVISSNRDGPWVTPIDKLSYPNHVMNALDTSHVTAFNAAPHEYCIDVRGYWIQGSDVMQYIKVSRMQPDDTHFEIDFWGNAVPTPVGVITAQLH